MAERDSGWISGGVVDAEDARLATGVLAAPGSGPLQSRGGIRPTDGQPALVEASPTPSKGVTVRPFQAVIQGTRSPAAGSYLVTLDAVKTVDVLGAAPADSSNERRDLIVARQFDPQYADSRTGMVVERVTGTPAATPVDPVVPGDHLKLARIRVRAGATAISSTDITDLRTYTGALGAILLARTAADRPVNPYQGLYVHRLDTNRLELWDGVNWRAPLEDDTGWIEVPVAINWTPGGFADQDEPTVRVRRVGRAVYLRGGATRRNSPGPHGTLVVTVPLPFRPRWAHRWVATCALGLQANAPQFYEMGLYADGTVVAWTDSSATIPVNEILFLNTSWLLEP
jgi:hypothetical protein